LAHNNTLPQPFRVSALAVFVLVIAACGGAAGPSAAPAAKASQTAASQAAPTAAASIAAAATNAPSSVNSFPVCALVTVAEAANILGKPIRDTRPAPNGTEACQYIVDPPAPLPAHKIGTPYPFNYIEVGLLPSSQAYLAPESRTVNSGQSRATVTGVKGDKAVTLQWADIRRDGQHPNADSPPITDATFAALKGLLATALTRL